MTTARLKQTSVRVTSAFGPRILKKTGRPNFHKGTDFAFGRNTPVSSFGAGVVTHAGWGKGADAERGIFVAVAHAPGIGTSYHSLDRVTVKEGDSIDMGDTIGFGGDTAWGAEFEHMHGALWLNGIYVNLEDYLTPGVVVTVSNTGQVALDSSKPFNNTAPAPAAAAPAPAATPAPETEDSTMKIIRQPDGIIALVGEHTAEQYPSMGTAQAFSIGVNVKAYGQVTGLTKDEATTLLNEARARRAKLLDELAQRAGIVAVDEGKLAATIIEAIREQLADKGVYEELDYSAISKAILKDQGAALTAASQTL